VALMLASFALPVQSQEAKDPDVKAAFMFNFMKFVEWPSGVLPSSGPIAACVMGNSAVAESLTDAVKGRLISGHQIAVSRVTLDGPLRTCHVLYLSGADARLTHQIAQLLTGLSVFTLSDFERFAVMGGVANFVVDNGRLRFAINVDAVRRARLQISSRMLALATIVNDEP
jgi:hypothetical protein